MTRLIIELEDCTVARLLCDLAIAMGAVEVVEVPELPTPRSIEDAWREHSERERAAAGKVAP